MWLVWKNVWIQNYNWLSRKTTKKVLPMVIYFQKLLMKNRAYEIKTKVKQKNYMKNGYKNVNN